MKNYKRKVKRIWALLLTALMIIGLIPTSVFAALPDRLTATTDTSSPQRLMRFNDGTVAYCIEPDDEQPGDSVAHGNKPVNYTRDDNYTALTEAQKDLIKYIIHVGYPTNAANIQGSMTDPIFEKTTQFAIFKSLGSTEPDGLLGVKQVNVNKILNKAKEYQQNNQPIGTLISIDPAQLTMNAQTDGTFRSNEVTINSNPASQNITFETIPSGITVYKTDLSSSYKAGDSIPSGTKVIIQATKKAKGSNLKLSATSLNPRVILGIYVAEFNDIQNLLRIETTNDPAIQNVVIDWKEVIPPAPVFGSLTIEKTIEGTAAGVDDVFHFDIHLQDKSGQDLTGDYPYTGINGAADGILSLSNGTASVALKGGQSITITDIPENTIYAVSEQEADKNGYTTTSVTPTGSITAGGAVTTFNNKKDAPPLPTNININVTKAWDDSNNQDGIRPNSVTVKLFADGENTKQTVTLNEGNKWTASFTDLAEYRDGTKIVYTVKEEAVTGYTSTTTGDVTAGFTITNTHTPETVAVTGSKTWDDNNNQDGKRPITITINLLADGVQVDTKSVTEADGWAWSFTNLAKYNAGTAINYTVTETTVQDYQTVVTGYNITNTYTPGKTSVSVTKAWDDSNNQDGIRPNSVTVKLFADGENTKQTVTLNEGNKWTASFTDLPEYRGGAKIVYTVKEEAVTGYTSTTTGDVTAGFTITNTHTPETVAVSGSKTWDDNNDQDGKRPTDITINLLADGVQVDTKSVTEADGWAWSFTNLAKYNAGTAINYTVTETTVQDYQTVVTGYNITNTYTPGKTSVSVTKAWDDSNNQDGIRPNSVTVKLFADGENTKQTVTLNEGNKWTASFTDLAEYRGGTKIVYTVKEEAVTGYTSTTTGDVTAGFTITNTHTPETVAVTGNKTWDDNNNQDGKRPTTITINLLADGVHVDTKSVTEADGWAWSFTNLAKYNAGTAINYTVTETTVQDYQTVVTGYNITNTYTPGKTSVSVTKAWDDSNNHDGIRPNSVTVKLFADGENTKQTVTLNEGNKWTASFTDLPEYRNGIKIVYTVKEEAVTGYTSTTTGDVTVGFTITNTHIPEKIAVAGSKTWDDNNNQDGKRPTSITIHLLNNGKNVGSKTVTEAEGWKWEFTDLPKKEAGKDIVYTITEEAVPGYQTAINGYDITNSYTPGKISINVVKSWKDNENQDGIRPDSVTVKLLANGKDTKKTVKLNAENSWSASFADLDEYKDKLKIVYTLEEAAVDGYKATTVNTDTNNVIITNAHDVETIGVEGSKQWNDNEDQDGKRPASITINLLANGKMVDSKVVSKEDNWKWSFKNLPKNEFGKVISYTVTEEAVPGYQTIVDGYKITNSYTPGKISIHVVKSWKDNNNQDKIRPDSVTVKLFADGKDTKQEVKLTVKNNWTASFTDLAEYKDGAKIVYTLTETEVKGYKATITGDGKGNFTITNTHNPSKPVTPSKPSKPNTPGTTNGNSNSPKTGDTTNSALMIMLFAISGLGIATVLITRKKKATNK